MNNETMKHYNAAEKDLTYATEEKNPDHRLAFLLCASVSASLAITAMLDEMTDRIEAMLDKIATPE